MQERIERLEWESEKKEREGKKNNIIIKGYRFKEKEELKKQVENFLSDNLKDEIRVKKAQRLRKEEVGKGGEIILVKLQEWKEKKAIMVKKKELKKGIYIEDDLTRKEREVQMRLRKIAQGNKREGKGLLQR